MSADARKYNIATLLDLARIPKDRVPAFLSELPRLLDDIRPLVAIHDELGKDQWDLIAQQLVWVDDGITDGSADVHRITFQSKPSR